jgi:hypothetical protein
MKNFKRKLGVEWLNLGGECDQQPKAKVFELCLLVWGGPKILESVSITGEMYDYVMLLLHKL